MKPLGTEKPDLATLVDGARGEEARKFAAPFMFTAVLILTYAQAAGPRRTNSLALAQVTRPCSSRRSRPMSSVLGYACINTDG
jgi:hypothetical protein